MHNLISKLLFIAFTVFCLGCSDNKTEKFSFIILQLNDVYEIAPMNNGKVAGLARVATLRKQLLKENQNTITVMAGDFLSPSLIGTMKIEGQRVSGAHMVESLNATGLDYATFGNHEFDLKENDLLERLNESKFNWTSANTFHYFDSATMAFTQNNIPIPNHIVHEFQDVNGTNFKLGIVSVTLPFNKTEFVSYEDPLTSFKSVYNEINKNCDAVIALTHLNLSDDMNLAKSNADLLMVLGGHEHANSNNTIGNVRITKADANAKSAYVHRISIDMKTGEQVINSELVPVNDQIAEDAEVKKIVDKWQNISGQNLNKLGYNPNEIIFETPDTLNVLEPSIRNGSTNFTKLVMQAYEFGFPEADVFLCNSGSIRLDDQLTGKIYQYDILKSFPYGGALTVANMTGEMLKNVFEISTATNKNTGGFLQMSGVSKEGSDWKIKGLTIDANKQYKVLIPAFVAAGNEQNLEFIKNASSSQPESLGPNKVKNDVRNLVIDYMKSQYVNQSTEQ